MAEREQLDDRALVARILEGDRDRFTELVRRYEKRLVNYVYRITHRYEEAHDLAQEIFVKVYLALDRYDPKYQFSTWLFRIAQNASIDALRKKSLPEVPLSRPTEDEPQKEREFADTGRFVFSICHGIQILVAAGLAGGRKLTCYEHVKSEVMSAGGEWIGQESVRDGKFVSAQTWISHPDFYRDVMQCLAGG